MASQLIIFIRQRLLLLACLLLAACSGQPPVLLAPSVPPAPTSLSAEQIRARLALLPEEGPAVDPATQDMSLKQGMETFYRERDYQPAWQNPAMLDQLLEALAELRFDGLDPDEYSLSLLRQKRANVTEVTPVTELADLELTATLACLLALNHLHRGKLDPAGLEPQWNFAANGTQPKELILALSRAIDAGEVVQVFDDARPHHPAYQHLRAGLRQLYAIQAQGSWPELPAGPSLKPGMNDARIALLRQRLALAGVLEADAAQGTYFDGTLEAAVRQFQQEQYLDVDGAVGKQTLAALNVPVQARIDQVRANLERGRWLLHEANGDFVLVDIAGFRIQLFRNGQLVWSARAQVGKPFRSTPIFKSRVTYATLNPTWTIPPTILKEDVLPKLRQDPDYLAKNSIRVLDFRGNELDPSSVDLSRPGSYMLRQDAGPHNPLGRVVIRFPNAHAVYLHDTPNQASFKLGQRAFSSGCIRIERPLELAELLFDNPQKWNREAIDAAIASGETRDVGFVSPVPILLTYSTVGLADDGRVVFKADIYERDPPLIAALGSK